MNRCKNCGWSETYGSIIMCRYAGHRTWGDECCEAWKPQEQETKKSKDEVLLAIIGKQSYTDLEKFKQLEELNDEYFNGMLDSIRAVEKLFDDH